MAKKGSDFNHCLSMSDKCFWKPPHLSQATMRCSRREWHTKFQNLRYRNLTSKLIISIRALWIWKKKKKNNNEQIIFHFSQNYSYLPVDILFTDSTNFSRVTQGTENIPKAPSKMTEIKDLREKTQTSIEGLCVSATTFGGNSNLSCTLRDKFGKKNSTAKREERRRKPGY